MEPPPSQAQPHSLFEAETQAHVTALLMLHGALMLPLRTTFELHGHACAFGVATALATASTTTIKTTARRTLDFFMTLPPFQRFADRPLRRRAPGLVTLPGQGGARERRTPCVLVFFDDEGARGRT